MHVLFYSDVNDYGGHEAMTLHAVRYLAKCTDWNISFVVYEQNKRIIDQLESIERIEIIRTQHRSRSLQGLRSWMQRKAVMETSKLLTSTYPDAVIVAQGGIEHCTVGLIASVKSHFDTISYIPYAHSYSKMHSALGPIRDLIAPTYYRLPSSYITIGKSMERDLRAHRVTRPIEVVPNGIIAPNILSVNRDDARSKLGIDSNDFVVCVVGRIVFLQKGQDILAKAIAKVRNRHKDIKLMVVGEGPDLRALKALCGHIGIMESCVFRPWQKDLAEIYASTDLLAIPSHFEGVPLVMLEAMACGKPIVASNVDGMLDTLPKEWLFESGNADSLVDAILRVRNSDTGYQVAINRDLALNEFSLERFGESFVRSIETLTCNA